MRLKQSRSTSSIKILFIFYQYDVIIQHVFDLPPVPFSTESAMSSTTTEVPLCWTNHSRIFGWDPDPNQPYQCRKAYAKVDEMDLDECKKSCITNFYNNPDKGCNAIDYGHADRQCAILHCSKPIVPTIYREGWNGYVWDPYQGWNGKKIICSYEL